MRTVALIGVPTSAGALPCRRGAGTGDLRAAGPGELLAGARVSRATTATATSGVAPAHRGASVAAAARLTTGRDDLEEPDPPADTRPLSPAIAIVRVRSGGALHRVRFRH
jgi:hypothetical protein